MKKIFLNLLFIIGVAAYANAQKSEVAEAKKKWSIFEVTVNSQPSLAKKLAALNSGLLNTDNAIANEKTKSLAETWSYRSLFAAAIAVADTLDEANSLAKQKIAEEAIEKTKSLDTKDAEKEHLLNAETNVRNAILLRGMRAYKKKDYESALAVFNQLIKLNPQDTSMYLNAGVTAKLLNRFPESIQHFKKVISLNSPDSKDIYSEIINISLNTLKDTTATLDLLKEALIKFPDDAGFVGTQTDIYIASGDIVKSQESLTKLIAKDSSKAVYHYLMGDTYYKQALNMQEERNKIDVKKVKEYNALTAKMMALIDQSLPFYKKSLALDPKFVPTLETLKQIYGFKNDTENFADVKKRLDEIDAAKPKQ
ncbi:MAG: tetratricopeptide repeat protein [Bacteroidota bacterium]